MEPDRDLAAIEQRLDELQRESEARRAELRALAARLPAATSRRALVRSMASSVVHAPDKPLVAKRVMLKVARTPVDLVRRSRAR
jgi:C4-dicarboxylate-specific signal transduction histidine kinase